MSRPLKFSVWFSVVIAAVFVVAWLWIRESSVPGPYDMEPVSTVRNDSGATNDVAGWQTYRNEEFGFEVKYPEYFSKMFEGKGDFMVGARSSTIRLSVKTHSTPLDGFRFINPFAGVDVIFNSKSDKWEGTGLLDAPELSTTLNATLYRTSIYDTTRWGEDVPKAFAKTEVAIIEGLSRNYVIEIRLSIDECSEIDQVCIYNHNTNKERFDQILSTFRFLTTETQN